MANKARISIEFIAQPVIGEESYIGFYTGSEIGSGDLIFGITMTAGSDFAIGASLEETANNYYLAYIARPDNQTPYFIGMSNPLTVELEAEVFDRHFNTFAQSGSFGSLADNNKVVITNIEEVQETFSVDYSISNASANPACEFVRFNFSQTGGTFPIVIDYSVNGVAQQKTATQQSEFWIERERYFTSQDSVFVTEAGGTSKGVQLPSVRVLEAPSVTFTQDINSGTNATVNKQDNGVGVQPSISYSIDGVLYSGNNIFQDVPAGETTFYTLDEYGCETSITVTVPSFQISEIYAVHNPLNFTIEKTTSPENVPCIIEVDGNSIGTFRAIPFDSFNGTNRYILFADEPIRANMPLFDDYPQPQGSLITVNNISARVKITEEATWAVIAEFVSVNAARQLGGEGAKMTDLVNNAEPDFVFVEGQPGYAYFYDNDFFREKILLTETTDITRLSITKSVEVLPHCDGDVILKYLDRNGMYRFYKFDKAYSISLEPEQIGRTQTIFESIATAQGITKNIGYKNDKQLDVIALKVPDKHMESLKDILVSPRVYMHIGDLGLDARENWVLVDVEADGEVKHPKRKFNDVRLTLTLPKEYNVTML